LATAIVLLCLACTGPRAVFPEGQNRSWDWTELRARAEAAIGLEFLQPVRVERVASADMQQLLRREIERQNTPQELLDTARALAVLGLVADDVDLLDLMSRFGGEATIGFYSPATRRLFVAADATGGAPDVEAIAIHELVHALQDQHTPWVRTLLGLREQDDLAFALGAWIEGQALFVEFREAQARGHKLPTVEEVASLYGAESAKLNYPDVPRILRDSLLLQYALGYELVTRAVERRGEQALRAPPPLSSEQLLHPEAYLDPAALDLPRFIELPRDLAAFGEGRAADPSCRELARTTLGELGLRIWLFERGVGEPNAAGAGLEYGWDGDCLVVLECGDDERLVWAVATDSPQAAARIGDALAAGFEELRRARPQLAAPLRVEARGDQVLATLGLGDAAREKLWSGLRASEPQGLEAFLAAHPEVRARAEALRIAP
jgi:hypothetical protein